MTDDTFRVRDLPQAQALELLDQVIDDADRLVALIESGRRIPSGAPAHEVLSGVRVDLSNARADLNALSDSPDAEISTRIGRVADLRARISYLQVRN